MAKLVNEITLLLLKYDVRDYFMRYIFALWKGSLTFLFRASGYVRGVLNTARARFLTSNGLVHLVLQVFLI